MWLLKKSEKIIADLPTKKDLGQMALHVNSTKQLRKKNHQSYTNSFKEQEKKKKRLNIPSIRYLLLHKISQNILA